jgi:signal transduction histidine kinase
MRPTRAFGTDLWRTLIEKLDEGVIVFNQRGVVIYANDEAARLLDYKPRDVLELDKSDVLALCDSTRLDGEHFATAFLPEELGDNSGHTYQVMTSSRRLSATPLQLDLVHGQVTVLLLREAVCWRSDMIAQTLMTEMRSPLGFTTDSAAMLSERLKSGDAHPYELNDLARIIRESQEHTMMLWNVLAYLYRSDPRQAAILETGKIHLGDTCKSVQHEIAQRSGHRLSAVKLELPSDLPAVRASDAHLQTALYILLEQSLAYLAEGDALTIKGSDRKRYVQLDLAAQAPGSRLRSHLLDELPLAAAEQIIRQHGGRVWVSGKAGRPVVLSLALPVWQEDQSNA